MARTSVSQLRGENQELRLRLEEAEQALEAIRTGQVESLVVEGPAGPRIFSLEGATGSYRVLIESMNEGAATLRHDGTILYCNRCFAVLLAAPLERVIGTAFREHIPDRFHTAFQKILERSRETSTREEFALRTSDGREIPTYLSVSSFVDAGTPVVGIVATDLREHKGRERLEALTEEMRAADQRKNGFLAVLAHELRNPLAAIVNSVDILEHAVPGGADASFGRQVIARQAQHLTHLIDDLLDVARISRGQVTLHCEPVELNTLARRAVEDHRDIMSRNGITLELEEAGEPLCVDGDPTRLAQILGNLLNNSAKFTPRGGKLILAVEAKGQADAVVRVQDSGVGMLPETLEHLFEPFAQAPQTIERTRGGLGLGLAIVKELVGLHGGKVTATSEGEGKGSELTVTLPLQSRVAPEVTVAMPATAPKTTSSTSRRVLVVEDNVDAAETLRVVLTIRDHDVAVAYSGPEGVEAARTYKPDAVFCDIGLPGMDGYGVARTLRADPDPTLRSMFLIALSGYARSEDISRSKEAGFDHHLAKPPSPQMLEKLLAEAPVRANAG